MNQLNISLLAAIIDCGPNKIRGKVPLWPEIDGVFSSEKDLDSRLTRFVQYVVETRLNENDSFLRILLPDNTLPLSVFERQGVAHFIHIESINRDYFESINGEVNPDSLRRVVKLPFDCEAVEIPILLDTKTKEKKYVNVRIDAFLSPPDKTRSVWVPVLDRIFSIPGNSEVQPALIEEINRIIARNDLLRTPDFIERMSYIRSVHGRFFYCMLAVPPTADSFFLKAITEKKEYPPESFGFTQANYSLKTAEEIEGFKQELELMTEAFDQPVPQSVLLVGPPGSGKTALWRKFVAKNLSTELAESFWESDAVSLVSETGTSPDECIRGLAEWSARKKPIFHLGNLWEIDQTGKSTQENRSIADLLLPAITRGQLPVVAECDQEQYTALDHLHPALLTPFLVIKMPEANQARNRAILSKLNNLYLHGAMIPEALSRLESLLTRYSPYESVPGAAAALMKHMAEENSDGEQKIGPIDEQKVTSLFSSQTGLPLFLLDSAVPLDMNKAREFFVQRVMGQGGEQTGTSSGKESVRESDSIGAVPIVLDVVETIKSRMTKQDGPIASLLFIGPTGVGKTELAKTLAEYLYGNPRKMVRIDMSEYAHYGAADRLINGTMTDEGILTAAVRAQPLGVVLLDEFEKAHSSVFDLLLQILGEGRLTDSRGRLADFRNCVIILTSNLGAENFGRSSIGFSKRQETDSAVSFFTTEVSRLVRPELLNRIDRIVPFHALSAQTLHSILERELSLLQKRQGILIRPISLELDEAVKEELVRRGYDPRYGARPLRRILEREILQPLAEELYDIPLDKPVSAHFKLESNTIKLEVRQKKRKSGKDELADRRSMDKSRLLELSKLCHSVCAIRNSTEVKEIRSNVAWWLQERMKMEAHLSKHPEHAWKIHQFRNEQKQRMNRSALKTEKEIESNQSLLENLDLLCEELSEQEVSAVLAWLSDKPVDIDLSDYQTQCDQMIRELYVRSRPMPETNNFWFSSDNTEFLIYFARLLDTYLKAQNMNGTFWYSRIAPEGILESDSPEITAGDTFYPYGTRYENQEAPIQNEDNHDHYVESADNVILEARRCKYYLPEYRREYCSFWEIQRNKLNDLVEPEWNHGGPPAAILLTGITAPCQKAILGRLSGSHMITMNKRRYWLWFGPHFDSSKEADSCFKMLNRTRLGARINFSWNLFEGNFRSDVVSWKSVICTGYVMKGMLRVNTNPNIMPPALAPLVLADYNRFMYALTCTENPEDAEDFDRII